MAITSASDGYYVSYVTSGGCDTSANREINLVNFLPNYLRYGETAEFMQFFEDFLNNMYFCKNSYRGNPATSGDEYKISILEKINRLTWMHDPDLIDIDYIQFFANYLGYNINITRGDIGNLANADLNSLNTNGLDPSVNIADSEVAQRYLRFAVRNLPNWYRLKTTRDSIKIMLFSFGLVGDILTKYTSDYTDGGYANDDSKWKRLDDRFSNPPYINQIPKDWYPTPHFTIAIDYDNSPPNWFKQIPMILESIENIRPVNTVLDEISAIIKRKAQTIQVRANSRMNIVYSHGTVNTYPTPIAP